MSEKSPRRRFSFSLRTMFVVVTVLCCWLGWESNVVRGRKAALNAVRTEPAFQITLAADWAKRIPAGGPPQPIARIPLVRRWLGDTAIQEIWYSPHFAGYSEAEHARLQRVFPEAQFRPAPLPLEPCHPGCFPRGTLVDTPQGPRAIESIQPGDTLLAFLDGGEAASAPVRSVFTSENELLKISTDAGDLLTTRKQPLCLAENRTLPAGQLQPGDRILRRENGVMRTARVLDVAPTGRTAKVFNLVLGGSHNFVAGGFLVRSKPPAQLAGQ